MVEEVDDAVDIDVEVAAVDIEVAAEISVSEEKESSFVAVEGEVGGELSIIRVDPRLMREIRFLRGVLPSGGVSHSIRFFC